MATSGQASSQESDKVVLINDVYGAYKQQAIEQFLASPIGAEAKKVFDSNKQSSIDQRARLEGINPMGMAPEQTGAQSWSITPGNR